MGVAIQRGMAKPRKRTVSADIGAPQFAGDTTVSNVDRDRVAARAYELYMARGGQDGMALEDWLQAERELATPGNRDNGNSGHGA